jgi:hypothetical protein
MRCTAVVWIAMVGCSSVDSTALPSAVTGRYEYRYVDHVPAVTVPQDLSQTTFQVYVVDESMPGGFARFPAEGPVTGHADGTFEIDDVPAGAFWLREQPMDDGPTFRYSATHAVSSTYDVLGRPDAVPLPYAQTTPLALDATGLAPWGANDRLFADCWGNATENDGVPRLLIPALTAGATSINASFNWNDGYSYGPRGGVYLMAARDGDFVLSRTTYATSAAVSAQTLTQVMKVPAIDQVAGTLSTIRGTFVDVPLDHNVTIAIDAGSIVNVLPGGNTITGIDVSLLAGPGSAEGLMLGPMLYAAYTTDNVQLNVNASYGDPFDATWPVIASGQISLRQPLKDPTGVSSGWLLSVMTLENGSYTFTAPPMPHTPTLDGIALDGGAIGWDGASPMQLDLHVDEPATEQSVMIENFTPGGGSSFAFVWSGSAPVDSARLIIPPELVHVGSTYTLHVSTWDSSVPSSGSLVTLPPFKVVAK